MAAVIAARDILIILFDGVQKPCWPPAGDLVRK